MAGHFEQQWDLQHAEGLITSAVVRDAFPCDKRKFIVSTSGLKPLVEYTKFELSPDVNPAKKGQNPFTIRWDRN